MIILSLFISTIEIVSPFFKLLSCVASEHLAGATTGYNLISSLVALQTSEDFPLPKLCTF